MLQFSKGVQHCGLGGRESLTVGFEGDSAHGHLRQKGCAPGEGGGTRPRTKPPRPAGQTPPSR